MKHSTTLNNTQQLRLVLIFGLFLFSKTVIFSQGQIFEKQIENKNEYSKEVNDKLDRIKSNKHYTEFSKVKVINPRLAEKNGKLKLNIPNIKIPKNAYAINVVYEDDNNYIWEGKISEDGKQDQGYVQIIAEKGEVFGMINFEDHHYTLSDLGSEGKGRINYLIKHDWNAILKSTCNSNETKSMEKTDSIVSDENKLETRNNSCPPNIKILFLYNQNASNAVVSVNQEAVSAITQFNSILSNNQIFEPELRVTLAGVAFLSFTENSNPSVSLDALKNNLTAQSLRNQYNADLVILFTQYNYSNSVAGIAYINDPATNSATGYGIVNILPAVGGKIFHHEIGHLLGCRHQDDSNLYSARGYTWTHFCIDSSSTPYIESTIMFSLPANSILRFSNPLDSLRKDNCTTAIGTTTNNSVAKIRSQAAMVGNFNTNNDSCIFISGPSYVYNTNQTFTWCVSSSYILGSTITWELSTNGYTYTPFASGVCGSKIGNTFPIGYNTVFIRVTVSINGQEKKRVKVITNWSYYNFKDQNNYPLASRNNFNNETKISPNPATDLIKIADFDNESEVYEYIINTQAGKRIKSGHITVDYDRSIRIDVSKIENGSYFIILKNLDKTISYPLIVLR